jgi:hypothetical protein
MTDHIYNINSRGMKTVEYSGIRQNIRHVRQDTEGVVVDQDSRIKHLLPKPRRELNMASCIPRLKVVVLCDITGPQPTDPRRELHYGRCTVRL